MEIQDGNILHLLPEFAAMVETALREANRECTGKFDNIGFKELKLFEGYRSQARQEALYDQGRTEAGNIVTNTPIPGYHGFGIAADCVWYDRLNIPHWDGDAGLWEIYFHCAALQGLDVGGRWHSFPDSPHVQANHLVIKDWRRKGHDYLKELGLSTPPL